MTNINSFKENKDFFQYLNLPEVFFQFYCNNTLRALGIILSYREWFLKKENFKKIYEE